MSGPHLHRNVFLIAVVVYLITAWNSSGFHSADEHFQIIAFAQWKLGDLPVEHLPWEFAAEIRSSFQPWVAVAIFKVAELAGIHDPFTQAFLLRAFTALLALFAMRRFVQVVMLQFPLAEQRSFIVLSYALWFIPFISVRFSSEGWSAIVLRLIQTAGLMGRNVIYSSATLPVPLGEAVNRAFGSGVGMRGALEGGEGIFGVVAVDDRGSPSVFEGGEDFAQRFRAHLDTLMKLPAKAVRRAFIQPIELRSREGFESAVVDAVRRLHGGHRWRAGAGKTLSFGLMRVAKIRTAIATARALALALPHARVACYHARDFRIHRHLKEQRLDFLLNRKRGDRHIVADVEIADLLAASPDGDVPFIVVATPVEEIGRDHDFDWCVIEPSSAHSIVQAAGRVNRHRLLPVLEPNIAILRYNARWAVGREGDAVFLRPGLESRVIGMWRYASSDMNVLLEGADLERLDVRLRLGECLMATEEDRIVLGRLVDPLKALLGGPANPSGWMTEGFYDCYRLRDGVPQRTWRAVRESGCWKFQMDDDAVGIGCGRNLALVVERLSNDWLCWDLDELAEACLEFELDSKEGLSRGLEFQYPDWGADAPSWDQSFGFS